MGYNLHASSLTDLEAEFQATEELKLVIKEAWRGCRIHRDDLVDLLAPHEFLGNSVDMELIKKILKNEFKIEVEDKGQWM